VSEAKDTGSEAKDTGSDQKYTGGCDCRAVRYEMTGPLRDVVNCHCRQCRRTHGHVAAYTNALIANFRFTEQRGLKWYTSSDFAKRGFCAECGGSIIWQADDSDQIGIAAGTIDGETGLKTIAEIFVEDVGDYYELAENLPHHQRTSS
jgi:hypothetical protein